MFDKLLKQLFTIVYKLSVMLIAIVIATTRRKVVYAYVIVIDNAMLVKTRTLNIAVLFYYSFHRKC